MFEHSLHILSDVPEPGSGLCTLFLSFLCFTLLINFLVSTSMCPKILLCNITNLVPKGQAEASSLLETSFLECHWSGNIRTWPWFWGRLKKMGLWSGWVAVRHKSDSMIRYLTISRKMAGGWRRSNDSDEPGEGAVGPFAVWFRLFSFQM
jgi:hypothetical protein